MGPAARHDRQVRFSVGSLAFFLLACGDGGGGDSCPSADDCVAVCGEGNVQTCSCADGEREITCKDGSMPGDGSDGDGSGGGDGDGNTGGGNASTGTDGGDGNTGGDDGNTGGGDDGNTGGSTDCGDLTVPGAAQWDDAVLVFDATPGFYWFHATFQSGPWTLRYVHKIYDGAPDSIDPASGDPPFETEYGIPIKMGDDPAELWLGYDDGAVSFQWAAIAGRSRVTELLGADQPTAGSLTGLEHQEWVEENGGRVVVPDGCTVSTPDLSWDGIAERA